MIQLRPYQADGVQRIREAFAAGNRAVLYVAPTGSGKTVLFTYIAANAAALSTRICICVHRRELLLQTSRALRAWCVGHGLIAPGEPVTNALVQVASIQTLVRRDAGLFDLLVFDEGHHGVCDTWDRVVQAQPDAAILGVTATPCRLSGRGLGQVYDEMIIGPSVLELIEGGYLVPAQVYAPAKLDVSGLRSRGGDYLREQIEDLMDKSTITGCAVDHYRRLADGVPAVAFCVSLAHADHVAEQFRQSGYRAASIDGTLSQAERDDRIASLADGRLQVLTSCDLISEGVDVPILGAAILLRPTKSTGLYLQQVGRVLRPAPGKEKAIVLDHVGNVLRHGLPDQPRAWSLEQGLVKGGGEKSEKIPRECPYCYAVHVWAPSCPECGFIYPVEAPTREIEQVDGELQPITPDEREALLKSARSLNDLHDIAKRSGYKPGWAWLQWKKLQQQRRRAVSA